MIFEASEGTSDTGDIALDDISFDWKKQGICELIPTKANPPTPPPAPKLMGNCTFGSRDTCGWGNVNSEFMWSTTHGSTGNSNTGPPSDHTLGTGKDFLYQMIGATYS